MHGHEGLGIVVDRGIGVKDYDCKIGDYVATRGELHMQTTTTVGNDMG